MSHLSHVYDTGGSLYVTVVAARDATDPVGQWQAAKAAACEAIVAQGATITHHHAVGRDHAPYLAAEIGENGVELLRAIKTYLDPDDTPQPWSVAALARNAGCPGPKNCGEVASELIARHRVFGAARLQPLVCRGAHQRDDPGHEHRCCWLIAVTGKQRG